MNKFRSLFVPDAKSTLVTMGVVNLFVLSMIVLAMLTGSGLFFFILPLSCVAAGISALYLFVRVVFIGDFRQKCVAGVLLALPLFLSIALIPMLIYVIGLLIYGDT